MKPRIRQQVRMKKYYDEGFSMQEVALMYDITPIELETIFKKLESGYTRCSIKDCERPYDASGWCSFHYKRWKANGDPLKVQIYIDGRCNHPLHKIYSSMTERCYYPTYHHYDNYGGRGIKICDRWRDPEKGFWNFVEDMGKRPSPKHSIDRIDVDGDYTPENCRWATMHLQNANKRNSNEHVGVSWDRTNQKWSSSLTLNGVTVLNTTSITLEKAIKKRRDAEIKYLGGLVNG